METASLLGGVSRLKQQAAFPTPVAPPHLRMSLWIHLHRPASHVNLPASIVRLDVQPKHRFVNTGFLSDLTEDVNCNREDRASSRDGDDCDNSIDDDDNNNNNNNNNKVNTTTTTTTTETDNNNNNNKSNVNNNNNNDNDNNNKDENNNNSNNSSNSSLSNNSSNTHISNDDNNSTNNTKNNNNSNATITTNNNNNCNADSNNTNSNNNSNSNNNNKSNKNKNGYKYSNTKKNNTTASQSESGISTTNKLGTTPLSRLVSSGDTWQLLPIASLDSNANQQEGAFEDYPGNMGMGRGVYLETSHIDFLMCMAVSEQSRDALISRCEAALLAADSNNLVQSYLIAAKYGLRSVMDRLIQLIRDNFVPVTQTRQFLELPVDLVELFLSDTFVNVADELDVFSCALRWIDYNKQERLCQAGRILNCVRYEKIQPVDIRDHVEPNIHLFNGPCGPEALVKIYRKHALACYGIDDTGPTDPTDTDDHPEYPNASPTAQSLNPATVVVGFPDDTQPSARTHGAAASDSRTRGGGATSRAPAEPLRTPRPAREKKAKGKPGVGGGSRHARKPSQSKVHFTNRSSFNSGNLRNAAIEEFSNNNWEGPVQTGRRVAPTRRRESSSARGHVPGRRPEYGSGREVSETGWGQGTARSLSRGRRALRNNYQLNYVAKPAAARPSQTDHHTRTRQVRRGTYMTPDHWSAPWLEQQQQQQMTNSVPRITRSVIVGSNFPAHAQPGPTPEGSHRGKTKPAGRHQAGVENGDNYPVGGGRRANRKPGANSRYIGYH